MNGLEAIKAMQEGKIVTEGTNIFKIEKGNVLSSYVGSCAELNDGVFNTACGFDFSLTYEEYIPPKTGWEGDYGERYFYVNSECFIFGTWDNDALGDKRAYDKGKFVIDNHLTFRDLGQVYFVSYDVAKQASEMFEEDLIKYFTHNWSKGE